MNRYLKALLLVPLFMNYFSSIAFAEQEISTRIVGGQESQGNDWPWAVSLKSSVTQQHFCGASLIASQWVLTTAHCVVYNDRAFSPLQIIATVGEYDLSSDSVASSIEKIYVHPDFNSATLVNDVALIKLTVPIENLPNVARASNDLAKNAIANQDNVTVLGWGTTTAYDPGESVTTQPPTTLRQVTIPLMTDTMCSDDLGEQYHSPEMLCAGLINGGKDACQGDSGGPLVINQEGQWQQLGIVGWGYGCAAAGYPGVYTRVSNYNEWINSVSNGVYITNRLEFADTVVNSTSTKIMTITNNADNAVKLMITQTGSTIFNVDNSYCSFVKANTSCDLIIRYSPTDNAIAQSTITILSDLPDSIPMQSQLLGLPLIPATDIASSADFNTDNITWFTGGFAPWLLDQNSNHLTSGAISDDQKSILKAQIMDSGKLDFAWAADSEANFDFLSVIINDQQVAEISASDNFQKMQFFLPQQKNNIVWIYQKDQSSSKGADQGYLSDVFFVPMSEDEYQRLQDNNSVETNSGGALAWINLILLPLIFFRRVYFP